MALHGSPKWWRYRPEPMNRLGKTVLLAFFISLLAIPVLAEAYRASGSLSHTMVSLALLPCWVWLASR